MIGQKLKLRYLKPRQWCDKDEVLIHAMFEVLSKFVEDEAKGIKLINWNDDNKHKHAKSEINILYKWWKKRQNRDRQDPLLKKSVPVPSIKSKPIKGRTDISEMVFDESWENPKWVKACKDHQKFEIFNIKEDEDMMTRLIKIRQFLWT